MESRGRKILSMVLDDQANRHTESTEEPQIAEYLKYTCVNENYHNTAITTPNINSSTDSSKRTMVEKWIDSNNFENQDPMLLNSETSETVNTPIITASDTDDITVEKCTDSNDYKIQKPMLVDISDGVNPPIINKTSGNEDSDSSNNGDFSPSEGSEYKPPSRAREIERNTRSSQPRNLSSSSSSSNSSSSSSTRAPQPITVDLENDEGNIETEPTFRTNEDNVVLESNRKRSRKRQRNMISSEKSNIIFKSYWELGTHQRQRDFLASCVKQIHPATRRVTVTVNSTCKEPRKPNSSFYFIIDGKEVRVCRTFLLNTLVIGEKTLRNVIDSVSIHALSVSFTDKRGKHGKHCKLTDEEIQSVHDHINSIPRTESHYLRANTTREYIDGSLTIAELHRSYKRLRQEAGRPAVNYDAYHRIFNTDFNLGLFAPRKDQCDECEGYKNAVDKEPLMDKHKLHLEEKSLARLELEKDIEQSKQIDSNNIVAIFDLQAVLPSPIGQSSAFFYKSKINCYNFTVSNINDDTTLCFFWHEGLAKRGANEIGTCIYKFLEELSHKQRDKDIILYSDNCCGQQKNKFVFGMYYYAVNTLPIKSITQKFLIIGHTQNKADSVHSVIEKNIKRAKKAGPIYSPVEYISLIRNAKKSGDKFIVKEMNFDLFFDLKLLADEVNLNLNKDIERNNVKLSEMKAIKFTKRSETYQFRNSYKSVVWTKANVKIGRTANRKQLKDITLNVLYTEKLPIPNRKKEDIRQLIASNIVPKFYEQFYNGLF
ncbi:unnamed protein product [Parnassius mnemosyne]|uniref:DUF7869 domain-containing protein n=1 Tax=Parnassius mnemosyne TaxID=213953 RepID=A0AAV1L8F7_9NEOP